MSDSDDLTGRIAKAALQAFTTQALQIAVHHIQRTHTLIADLTRHEQGRPDREAMLLRMADALDTLQSALDEALAADPTSDLRNATWQRIVNGEEEH